MDLRVRYCKDSIKIGVIDTPKGHSHSEKVIKIIKEFVPNAEIILVSNNYKGVKTLIEEKPALVNMSMGTTGSYSLEKELSKYSFLITSAGNNGAEGEKQSASKDFWCAVGAIDKGMKPKYYSSYGYDKVKTVAVPRYGEGTSFSAPVVTGLIAQWYCWYHSNTGYYPSTSETNEFIKRNSHDIWDEGKDPRTGYGLLRLPHKFEARKVTLTLGKEVAKVEEFQEGKEVISYTQKLYIPSELKNDRTLVGSRDIAEMFGLNVEWENNQSFYIRG